MAERFGRHIIADDGSLDRGAVAQIVFRRRASGSEDLNGIVHPAMQDEIQRQIDEHRDTDRVVVLDFPLLGENPRKGMAATIVVDIPVDVAVERLVEHRGMDEADARNRINSQISREQRLEPGHPCDRQLGRPRLAACRRSTSCGRRCTSCATRLPQPIEVGRRLRQGAQVEQCLDLAIVFDAGPLEPQALVEAGR